MREKMYASGLIALFCSIILFFGSGLNSIGFFVSILLFIYFICVIVVGVIMKTSESLEKWVNER